MKLFLIVQGFHNSTRPTQLSAFIQDVQTMQQLWVNMLQAFLTTL